MIILAKEMEKANFKYKYFCSFYPFIKFKKILKGYSVNIPWNQVSGDAEYIAAFLRIVMPVAYEVNNLFQQ
jgi:acetoin utilization deacetylase AcuC-like enzyme